MSTFEELTEGSSEAANTVENFFISIRATFSPVPIIWAEQISDSSGVISQVPAATKASLFPSSISRKRPGSSFSEIMLDAKRQKRLNLIVVVHLLPTLPAYLRALKHVGNIKVIIFKGTEEAHRPQHMNDMAKWVKNDNVFGPAVCGMTKDDLKKKENVINILSDAAGSDEEEILIMDIGGYFAPCLLELCDLDNYKGKWKLLGIVEDTENGHQKYHAALERFLIAQGQTLKQPNIYSVARSQMKTTEDYNVGKSLVRAADSILRQSLDLRLEDYCIIGVIGFGKIGSSIAMHLRQQHIGTVMVYDINPAIMLRALSHDFVICTKNEMLQKASFIFCATGNKSLTYNDLLLIGSDINRLIIASCTSADDELDVHNGLQQHKNDSPDLNNFSRYTLQRLNGEPIQVILLCDGNAVNFHCRAVLGESIRSVQAAMMVCALKLQHMALKDEFKSEIQTLTAEDEMTIARLWLQHFPRLDVRLVTNVRSAHTKFDVSSVAEIAGDLPIDEKYIKELKEHLGLLRRGNTDSIDFMDSERKLIITASRGFGKTAVLFSLIHDIRNYYDLIWWFDCDDSLNGTLLSLAQEFRVSSVALSFDQLRKDVLKAVFLSLEVNSFLLIVDNVQELDSEKPFDVTANIAHCADNLKSDVRQLKCHSFLSALNTAVKDPSVRHQRRRHIVALYTDDSTNQPPSTEPTSTQGGERAGEWVYTSLQAIEPVCASEGIVRKLFSHLEAGIRKDREELFHKISSIDSRRLTIRLNALFLTSRWITNNELTKIKDAVDKPSLSESPDMLSYLIKLSLSNLKEENEHFLHCVQVASLIRSGSISCEVFHRLYDISVRSENTANTQQVSDEIDWKTNWESLLRKLKKYCILKQNLLAPMIHTHVSQRYVPLSYVEVYSMSSTYVKALRTPLLKDKTSPIWNYALQLINDGFSYDYYSFDAGKNFQYEQNVVHYLDHATTLIEHTKDWGGFEPHARLIGELLCRLGSYYLNERRIYSEASRLYFEATTIFNKILNLSQNKGDTEAEHSSILILKWSATLMWHICEQLTDDSDIKRDKEFISKIAETLNNLKRVPNNKLSESDKNSLERYQHEAVIAIARIRVQNVRNENISGEERSQWLQSAKEELEGIQNKENMGARTRSLLLQILGSTYSLLKEYEKAVPYFRQALTTRENILQSEHLDAARTKYRLARCLVEYIRTMSEEDRKNKVTEIKDKLNEARRLCEAAFRIQKTQLSTDHRNFKECRDLRREIDELFEDMKPKKTLQ